MFAVFPKSQDTSPVRNTHSFGCNTREHCSQILETVRILPFAKHVIGQLSGHKQSHLRPQNTWLAPRIGVSRRCQGCDILLCSEYIVSVLWSKRGKIKGPVRKTHSSVLVANNPVQHQRTPFANFRNRSHLAVRKTHHGAIWEREGLSPVDSPVRCAAQGSVCTTDPLPTGNAVSIG